MPVSCIAYSGRVFAGSHNPRARHRARPVDILLLLTTITEERWPHARRCIASGARHARIDPDTPRRARATRPGDRPRRARVPAGGGGLGRAGPADRTACLRAADARRRMGAVA